MKLSILALAALLLVATSHVRASEEPDVDEKDVVVLTDDTFKDTIAKAKYALVEFYAPWCGHCKSLKAPYAAAATALKASSPDVILAKLDATEHKKAAEEHKVQGFPTIKWFVDGEPIEYSGGRTEQDIVRWVEKKTGPATTVLESEAEIAKVDKNEVSLIAYFSDFSGDAHDAFESTAQKNDDAAFFKTSVAAVAAKFGLKKAGTVVLRRNYEGTGVEDVPADGNAAFAGKTPFAERLAAFITAEKLPAFIEFKQSTSKAIFQSGITKQVITVAPSEAFKAGGPLAKAIADAGAKLRGQVVMVISKTDSEDAGPILNFFGLKKEAPEPQVVGFAAQEGKKYIFKDAAMTSDALVKFGKAVIDGTAPRFFKSAPLPAEPTEDGVTVVVGDTVESIVMDPTKDVLLEVYAPWCGHCKSLAPIYSKLAKRFKDIDSVVIAKMDGTENEYPDIEVKGYPTLLFFPAEKGAAGIPFNGNRELLDMTKFIKEQAKVPYELAKKSDAKKDGDAGDEEVHDEL